MARKKKKNIELSETLLTQPELEPELEPTSFEEAQARADEVISEVVADKEADAELKKTLLREDTERAEFDILINNEIKKAKNLSDEGISLVGKATNLKRSADNLLAEGKQVMERGAIYFGEGEGLTIVIDKLENRLEKETALFEKSDSWVSEIKSKLQAAMFERDNRLANKNHTAGELTLRYDERTVSHNRGEELRQHANSIISKAQEASQDSQRMLKEGSELIKRADEISNATQASLNQHITTDFTNELKEAYEITKTPQMKINKEITNKQMGPSKVIAAMEDELEVFSQSQLDEYTIEKLRVLAEGMEIESFKTIDKVDLIDEILMKKEKE